MYVFNHWKMYVLVNKYIEVVHITSYRFDTRNVCLITRKLQRQPWDWTSKHAYEFNFYSQNVFLPAASFSKK